MRRPRPEKIEIWVRVASSTSWSAVQSQTFSMYNPVAVVVTCMLMNAAMHWAGTVVIFAVVLGQFPTCKSDPLKPPMRVWTSLFDVLAWDFVLFLEDPSSRDMELGVKTSFKPMSPELGSLRMYQIRRENLTYQIPDGIPVVARLYSIRIAPAWAPWVETIMSDHSIVPTEPGIPT